MMCGYILLYIETRRYDIKLNTITTVHHKVSICLEIRLHTLYTRSLKPCFIVLAFNFHSLMETITLQFYIQAFVCFTMHTLSIMYIEIYIGRSGWGGGGGVGVNRASPLLANGYSQYNVHLKMVVPPPPPPKWLPSMCLLAHFARKLGPFVGDDHFFFCLSAHFAGKLGPFVGDDHFFFACQLTLLIS